MKFTSSLFAFLYIALFAETSSGARVRIVGGDFAPQGFFKYQVSLQFNGHFCGGAIISDEHIVTAAHCVIDGKTGDFHRYPITVVMGTRNLLNTTSTTVSIDVEKIYVPKEFQSKIGIWNGDIAVLKLKNPIGLSRKPQLSKLKLPTNNNQDYVGKIAIVTGFGLNHVVSYNKGTSDRMLRYAYVDIISQEDCQAKISSNSEKQICGILKQRERNKPEGVCSGDNGGPLVLNMDTLIGIVSLSPAECKENHDNPAEYTRVTSFLSFLEKAQNDLKDDTMRLAVFEWRDATSQEEFVEH